MNAWLRLVQTLLIAFAFSWPLATFLYVPVAGVNVTPMLASLIIIAFAIETAVSRRLRVPPEYLLPAAVLVGIAVAFALAGDTELALSLAVALALGFAVSGLVEDGAMGNAVAISLALGGGVAGAFELFGRRFDWFPTATIGPLLTGHVFGGVYSSMLTLALCGTLGVFLALRSSSGWGVRFLLGAAGAAALTPAMLDLIRVASAGRGYFRDLILRYSPAHLDATALEVLALFAGLWLLARIGAKLVLKPATKEWPLRQFLVVAVLTAILVAALTPLRLRYGYGFLAGLAAGVSLPSSGAAPRRSSWIACALILGLALANTNRVRLEDTDDPRNYAASVERYVADNLLVGAYRKCNWVSNVKQPERRLWLLRAQIALAANQPDIAATAFAQIFDPGNDSSPLLPNPSAGELRAFLADLESTLSRQQGPLNGLVMAQALFAHGETDSALFSIRSMTGPPPFEDSALNPQPLRAAVAAIVALDPLRTAEFADFTVSECLGVLVRAGARIQTAPPDFPRTRLPLVVTAWHEYDAVNVAIASPLDSLAAAVNLPPARRPGLSGSHHFEVEAIEASDTDPWRFALVRSPDLRCAVLRIRADQTAATLAFAVQPPLTNRNFAPSILVWVP